MMNKLRLFLVFSGITVLSIFCMLFIYTNQANSEHLKALDNVKMMNDSSNVKSMQMIDTLYGKKQSIITDNGFYIVDPQTNKLEYADVSTAKSNSKLVKIDLKQAQKKARDYANKFNDNFANDLNLQLVDAQLLDHGNYEEYVFTWREVVNGIYTLNCTSISLNPNTGELIKYQGLEKPVTVALEPQITREEAINLAQSQFNIYNATQCTAQLEVVYYSNMQRFVWSVDIVKEGIYCYGGTVWIDAVTGEIIHVNPLR